MEFGVVLQTTPPSRRVVDLAKRAEAYGFDYVWTFDSHILWQEPYVIYSQILAETRNVIVGPGGTTKLTDLALAKRLGNPDKKQMAITQAGQVLTLSLIHI